MLKQLISLVVLIVTSQAIAEVDYQVKRSDQVIQNRISSCTKDGAYLIKDGFTLDKDSGEKVFKRVLYTKLNGVVNRDGEPLAYHKTKALGPKKNYSISEAKKIFNFNSELDFAPLVLDNDGWKCLTPKEIQKFYNTAERVVLKIDTGKQLGAVDIMGNPSGQH
jgi:hypothetical protein